MQYNTIQYNTIQYSARRNHTRKNWTIDNTKTDHSYTLKNTTVYLASICSFLANGHDIFNIACELSEEK
jgi:hypothetical protein